MGVAGRGSDTKPPSAALMTCHVRLDACAVQQRNRKHTNHLRPTAKYPLKAQLIAVEKRCIYSKHHGTGSTAAVNFCEVCTAQHNRCARDGLLVPTVACDVLRSCVL